MLKLKWSFHLPNGSSINVEISWKLKNSTTVRVGYFDAESLEKWKMIILIFLPEIAFASKIKNNSPFLIHCINYENVALKFTLYVPTN